MENDRIDWIEGSPRSRKFNDIYYSRDGGPEESLSVFLKGNFLPERWAGRSSFTICETGFGTGLNFFASASLFLKTASSQHRLYYFSAEKHPLTKEDFTRTASLWPEFSEISSELLEMYPPALEGFHPIRLSHSRVYLILMYGDAGASLKKMTSGVDAWFLDGFSPAKNPEMWSDEIFHEAARLSLTGATLATYTSAGFVRRGLESAGFRVERAAGFGGKNEMLRGTLERQIQEGVKPEMPIHSSPPEKAVIIGAGFAGTSAAFSLASRGIEVTLIDKSAVASGASGNPAGIYFPQLTMHETVMSRFSLASYAYLIRHLRFLKRSGLSIPGDECGVLQLFADEDWEKRLRSGISILPESVAALTENIQAAALSGCAIAGAGIFFPEGGWLAPPALCLANTALYPDLIRFIQKPAVRIDRNDYGSVSVLDEEGGLIAQGDAVVLAAGHDTVHFTQGASLSIRRVRGQIVYLEHSEIECSPRVVVCYDGYLTPSFNGRSVLGSTYHPGDDNTELNPEHTLDMIEKMRRRLPGVLPGADPAAMKPEGRVGFRSAGVDHLPLIGPLELTPGVYVSGGHGSRGLLSAHLGAEIIASQITGSPLPVENDLVQAVSPSRFLRRQEKKDRARRALR